MSLLTRRRSLFIQGNKPDFKKQYLTLTALESTTFSVRGAYYEPNVQTVYYSTNLGSTWNSVEVQRRTSVQLTTVNAGDSILIKGALRSTWTSANNRYIAFESTGQYEVSGNIMSLLYSDFTTRTAIESTHTYAFRALFDKSTTLVSAENLVLPAATLTRNCYASMFQNCTSLIKPPKLPATTLTSNCYEFMFSQCTSLPKPPKLPATTLASMCYEYMFQACSSMTEAPALPAIMLYNYCYEGMFRNCTSLTIAPELPATLTSAYCYKEMFEGCTSLVEAPVLPAISLSGSQCYQSMFKSCSNLSYIKAMFKTKPSDSTTKDWVSGVAASGVFVKNSAATWDVTGTNGIPSGWTVQTASS